MNKSDRKFSTSTFSNQLGRDNIMYNLTEGFTLNSSKRKTDNAFDYLIKRHVSQMSNTITEPVVSNESRNKLNQTASRSN